MKGLQNLKSTAIKPTISPPTESIMPLEQITDRPGGDSRPLNQEHVKALSESIEAVGLVQPIAVDIKGQLLAGGHRKAAIFLLKETNPIAYTQWFSSGIPIRRFDFDAAVDEARALAIEATENEKRRDYTAAEVRELADRLVAAGYRQLEGRPKKGEKALAPTLAVIVGKSQRTIERYLAKTDEETPTGVGVSKATVFNAQTVRKQVDKWLKQEKIPKDIKPLLKELAEKLREG
jgi:ParB family transcriptional regulator, chromosome partitioning protein